MISTARYPIAGPIFSLAKSDPDRLALLSPEFKVTYRELACFITTFVRRLQLRGVGRTSFLALSITDDVSVICSAVAASIIGCRWINMSERLTKLELGIQPTHILHDNYRHNVDSGNIICVGPWQFNADIQPDELVKFGFEGYEKPTDIWHVATSSGSTGIPKFIGIAEQLIRENLSAPKEEMLPNDPKIAILFKANSIVGLNSSLRTFVWHGTVILHPTMSFLVENRPDQVVGSPNQITALLNSLTAPPDARFKSLVSTGSPLNEAFVNFALDHFDVLINRFGSTEFGRVATKYISAKGPGPYSVGVPVDGIDLEIVDENNHLVPKGEEGILRLRKPSMVTEYLFDKEDRSSDVFRNGWFYTGDMAYVDDLGELYISGRVRDTLNLGGLKVAAQSIDNEIMSIEGVADCLSFSEIDASTLATLSVLVELKNGNEVKNILNRIYEHYTPKINRDDAPKRIYFVEKIPRNSNGKAMRHLATSAADGVQPILLKDVKKNSK